MADLSRDARLKPDEPVLTAVSKLFFHLSEEAWRQAQGTAASDADALHDMRVALRRLRSALQNFEGTKSLPLLDRRVFREFAEQRGKLGKIGDVLGVVRDHDVLDDYLQTYSRERLQLEGTLSPGLAHFERWLQNERAAAFLPMVKRLARAQEPGKLRESFGRWALGLPALETSGLTLREAALVIVPQRLDAVRLSAAALNDGGDADGHHNFRKALRRLRYALETLGVCFDGSLKPQLKLLVQAQDLLGEMQDRDVLAGRAREAFAPDSTAESDALPQDVATFLRWGEMRRRRLLGQTRAWWAKNQEGGVLTEIQLLLG